MNRMIAANGRSMPRRLSLSAATAAALLSSAIAVATAAAQVSAWSGRWLRSSGSWRSITLALR